MSVENTMKLDATYYNNPNIKTIESFFKVNPAFEEPILAELMGGSGLGGQLDFSDFGLTSDWIQYDAIIAAAGNWISDRLKFTSGQSKRYPALRKAKMFGWGVKIRHDDFLDLNGGGPLARRIMSGIETQIQTNKARMQDDMLRWSIATTTTFASEIAYDYYWRGLFANSNASTPSDPNSIMSTPQTTEAYATNMTGTNKSKDFILNSFGKVIKKFENQIDSTSKERMLKPSGNSYICLMHPSAISDLNLMHPYNGVQDDQAITYAEEIAKLGIRLVPTYYVDATYDNSEDGTVDMVTIANMADNFKLAPTVKYTETDWYEQVVDGILYHFKTAYQKVLPVIRPFYISGYWRKAEDHSTFVSLNDAG